MNDPNQTHRARQVGPYRLLRQIGVGAMGEIYLVQHTETDERFALKRIRGDFADEEELIRFRREAELVARVYHPHVVRLRDSNFATAHPYQVYELYEGGTLKDRLQREGKLSLEVALEITSKLGQGLSHAHSQGVLHRDLKPENILFDAEGEPALADFGLARRSVSKGNSLTATGEAIGTPVYMAPEQVLDSKRVDERADLYGLAAITYAMLSGGPPVVGANTVLEAYDKVINEPPPPLGRPDVPAGVERVVLAALAKDPDERPSEVATWVQQLTQAGKGGRGVPLHWVALAGVALLSIASVATWAGLRPAPSPAPPEASSPEASSTEPQPAETVEATAPSPLPPIQAPRAVPPASLRPLFPRPRSWAWLTIGPPEGPGVSLLLTCARGDEEVVVQVTRGRYVSGGEVWDSVWRECQPLAGFVSGVGTWRFGLMGQPIFQAPLPQGTSLETAAGEALERCLEPGAAAALFRHLARTVPEPETGIRRAKWGSDSFAWEPLLWGEMFPKGGLVSVEAPPPIIQAQLTKFRIPQEQIELALSPSSWESALTMNRCHGLRGMVYREEAHFALPHASKRPAPKVKGSVLLAPKTPVFWRPRTLLLGLSLYARYFVYRRRGEWLQIGWGGALGWVRAAEYDADLSPTRLEIKQESVRARLKPYYPGKRWKKRLGANPPVCHLLSGRLYPFAGVLSGPPDMVEVKRDYSNLKANELATRWAKVAYADQYVWIPWWEGNSGSQKNATPIMSRR